MRCFNALRARVKIVTVFSLFSWSYWLPGTVAKLGKCQLVFPWTEFVINVLLTDLKMVTVSH